MFHFLFQICLWINSIWDGVFDSAVHQVLNNDFHKASFSLSGKDIILCATFLKINVEFKTKLYSKILNIFINSSVSSYTEMKETILKSYHMLFVNNVSMFVKELLENYVFSNFLPIILNSTVLEITANYIHCIINEKQSVLF